MERRLMRAITMLRKSNINWKVLISGTLIALLSIMWYYPTFFYIFIFILYSAILVIAAIVATIYVHHVLTTKPPPKINREPLNLLHNVTRSNIFDLPNPIQNASNLPLIFGKTVDLQLQQIVEYILRDFMTPWLRLVVNKPKLFNNIVREDFWNAVQKIYDRAAKIDAAKVIAVDMVNRVTVHLEKIRISESRALETGTTPVFSTNFYLANDEIEMEFLRKLSEIMVILLLPNGYSLPPLKLLLSEILACKIFFPLIKILTAPDYINQKIVQNIESRLAAAAINKRSYEYAASFEDFLKIINNSGNLEELSLIRKTIVNDLMHATTMQNIQRAKRSEPEKENQGLSKSDVAASMRLKRYIQQLSLAKTQCEKNLSKFGWNCNYSSDLDPTLAEILNSSLCRRHLTLFLEPLKASALVGFYLAVEELKLAPQSSWHQLGTEIFYSYIRVPKPEIQIDKHERKLIETFLLGDTGPEVFFDIQSNVFKTLDEKYYSSFVLSEQYRLLKEELSADESKEPNLLVPALSIEGPDEHKYALDDIDNHDANAASSPAVINVATHTSYARKRLEQLQERIDKKNQAMDALKYSVKPESKVLQVLEKEMDWLKSEMRQTETHLKRTDAWVEHLGKWKATIQSVEILDEKESLHFMILVHVNEDINIHLPTSTPPIKENRSNPISSGWVIMRSLNQFHELHRKLRPVCASLKSHDLPTNFKLFFLKNDKQSLEKAKGQIQKFLNFILEDDHLNRSEAIYAFLSPSSDHLKQTLPSPKKSKFSLSTLFKSDTVKGSEPNRTNDPFWGLTYHRDEEDISIYLEGDTSSASEAKLSVDVDNKDSIAEPLYALMGEIFDMGGVFKWLRKSIISFVQISYGRTINRQIRESVTYLFEESMLHYYCSTLLKSFWPGGVLASAYPVRSEDMKEMTANAAKALLMDNIPEVLCNLVGAQAAKRGVLKVFAALQNPVYNKQLFYELLEILMIEFFPEIRQLKIASSTTENKTPGFVNVAASGASVTGVGAVNQNNNHNQQHQPQHPSTK